MDLISNDITMCTNIKCKKAKYCYRTTAKSETLQSYSDFSKSCNEDNNYEMWLKNKTYLEWIEKSNKI